MKTLWTNIKNYTKDFIKEEDGMEFLQVAIIVALVAALIAVVAFVFSVVQEKLQESGEAVDAITVNPTPNNPTP